MHCGEAGLCLSSRDSLPTEISRSRTPFEHSREDEAEKRAIANIILCMFLSGEARQPRGPLLHYGR